MWLWNKRMKSPAIIISSCYTPCLVRNETLKTSHTVHTIDLAVSKKASNLKRLGTSRQNPVCAIPHTHAWITISKKKNTDILRKRQRWRLVWWRRSMFSEELAVKTSCTDQCVCCACNMDPCTWGLQWDDTENSTCCAPAKHCQHRLNKYSLSLRRRQSDKNTGYIIIIGTCHFLQQLRLLLVLHWRDTDSSYSSHLGHWCWLMSMSHARSLQTCPCCTGYDDDDDGTPL